MTLLLGAMQTLGSWNESTLIIVGCTLALLLECLTCLLRFKYNLEATRDTQWIAKFTRQVRIHHGYYGFALLAIAPLTSNVAFDLLIIWGIALTLSDAIHHFLVLWPLTGSPEFHLRYPR